jgi:hypothetical protein
MNVTALSDKKLRIELLKVNAQFIQHIQDLGYGSNVHFEKVRKNLDELINELRPRWQD